MTAPGLVLYQQFGNCGRCGAFGHTTEAHPSPPLTITQGWQCPVCGTVYAPTVATCQTSHQPPPRQTVGANDG